MFTMKNDKQNRKKWLAAPLDSRLKHMADQYLVHSAVQKILDSISTELTCNAARGLASGILVMAESGVGKSALIKHLMKCYPVKVEQDVTLRPLVTFKIPKNPTAKALGEALLRALGDPDHKSESSDRKFERIKVLLKACKTRIVAIDDFQDVPARRRIKGIAEVSDWLRDLCEIEFPGVVLALGTPLALVVRDSNVQLKRRMTILHEIPIFSFDTTDSARIFKEAMTGLEELLPLAQSSDILGNELLLRMRIASGGRFDYIVKLLVKALIVVVNQGGERMEMGHLAKAFQMLHEHGTNRGNPFDNSLSMDELHKNWIKFFEDQPVLDQAEEKEPCHAC